MLSKIIYLTIIMSFISSCSSIIGPSTTYKDQDEVTISGVLISQAEYGDISVIRVRTPFKEMRKMTSLPRSICIRAKLSTRGLSLNKGDKVDIKGIISKTSTEEVLFLNFEGKTTRCYTDNLLNAEWVGDRKELNQLAVKQKREEQFQEEERKRSLARKKQDTINKAKNLRIKEKSSFNECRTLLNKYQKGTEKAVTLFKLNGARGHRLIDKEQAEANSYMIKFHLNKCDRFYWSED